MSLFLGFDLLTMYYLNNVTVFDNIHRFFDDQIVFVGTFNDPPVVDVFKRVASDLLLVTRTSFIRISNRIHMWVRV